MMSEILALDEQIFLWINQLRIPLFEEFSPYYRHKLIWLPLYIFLASYFVINYGKKGWWVIVFGLITVGLSDTASSQWVKKSVQRLRPCNTTELQPYIIERVRCGGGYSFTSSHATNHGALAFYFFFILAGVRNKWHWGLLAWAVSISFAQVYVGVHYPLDVICGLLLGVGIGWTTGSVFNRYQGLIPASVSPDP